LHPLDDTVRPRQLPEFEAEAIDGQVVLLNPTTLRVAHLNRSAAIIWQLCDGERSVADIRSLLVTAYPESFDVVAADLQSTLSTLFDLGALVDAGA
jgi:hypothetical protein